MSKTNGWHGIEEDWRYLTDAHIGARGGKKRIALNMQV